MMFSEAAMLLVCRIHHQLFINTWERNGRVGKDDLDHHLSKHFMGCTAPYKVGVPVSVLYHRNYISYTNKWKSAIRLENQACDLAVWLSGDPSKWATSHFQRTAQEHRTGLGGFIRYKALMKYITTGDSSHPQIRKKNSFIVTQD